MKKMQRNMTKVNLLKIVLPTIFLQANIFLICSSYKSKKYFILIFYIKLTKLSELPK